MKKKIVSILLICSMLFTILPTGAAFAGESVVDSGICGVNQSLQWELTNDGVLTISGQGALGSGEKPWNDYLPDITTVIFEDGVTSIGSANFSYVVDGINESEGIKTIIIKDLP